MAGEGTDSVVDNGYKKEKEPEGTPVHFFDRSLKGVRRRVIWQTARIIFIFCVFILGVLSLYWGVRFGVEERIDDLPVWVVDFDGLPPFQVGNPIVGPSITYTARRLVRSPKPSLGFIVKPPVEFNYNTWAVRKAVYTQQVLAAIIVNPNATSLLVSALVNGNTSYSDVGTMQVIVNSARDQLRYWDAIAPGLVTFEKAAFADFGPRWVEMLVTGYLGPLKSLYLALVPNAVNPAIGFSKIDLRPFAPATATLTVRDGLVYLIIIAYSNFPFMMPVHAQLIKGDHPPMKLPDWVVWRLISNIIAGFFVSLFYSLVSLAFQVPFNNGPAPNTVPAHNPEPYSNASFVVFWMVNFVGILALGLPCENMSMIMGHPWSSGFLILWIIMNVDAGLQPLDLAPDFYRWGFAWPTYQMVEANRTILFGTYSFIGKDFGVLVAWTGGSMLFFPVADWIMRWKIRKGLAKL